MEREAEHQNYDANIESEKTEPPRLELNHDDVEFAAAYGAALPEKKERPRENQQESERNVQDQGKGLGVTALVIAIISLFLWPLVLAPVAIILGGISIRRGSSLGWWAVGIGLLSFIIMIVALPFRLFF
jgi:uncharacterized membrane protein YkgB